MFISHPKMTHCDCSGIYVYCLVFFLFPFSSYVLHIVFTFVLNGRRVDTAVLLAVSFWQWSKSVSSVTGRVIL